MGYWSKGYRGRKRKSRWVRHVSRFSELKWTLGDAVDEIREAFLQLGGFSMGHLMAEYGERYGEPAKRYAQETLPKWRGGTVELSGQTMERLVELVPPFLSASERFALLEKILKRNPVYPPTVRVDINGKEPGIGLANLDLALAGMRHTDALAHLPSKVMETATWLYANDITAARAMLAEVESRKNEVMRASAVRELDLLRRTITSGQIKNATYSVKMPAGTLVVSVVTPEPSLWQRLFG